MMSALVKIPVAAQMNSSAAVKQPEDTLRRKEPDLPQHVLIKVLLQ